MQKTNDFEQFNAQQVAKAEHAAEIAQSRVGGFGGSDADLFYRVGLGGMSALTATDLKRIAVMLGISQPDNFGGTPATNAGHDFEDYVDVYLMQHAEGVANYMAVKKVTYTRELKMAKKLARNFATFAHADFVIGKNKVVECKYVQKETAQVLRTYAAQLQWYYMLGATRVVLMHGTGAVPFDEEQVNAEMVDVERNDEFINVLVAGIKTLDDAIGDGWQPIVPDRADVLDAPAAIRTAYETLARIKATEDAIKAEKAAAQAVLVSYMQDFGYTSIYSETNTLCYTKGSEARTFDSAKFLKAHPEFDVEEFYKKTTRSASVSMKVNKPAKADK